MPGATARKQMIGNSRLDNQMSHTLRTPNDAVCAGLAVVVGLLVGWLDLHITEVVVTILALLAGGLVLGLLQPVKAWRWAPLVAIGLPIMAAVAQRMGLQTAEPARVDFRIALVACAFALLGSYVGVFIRRAARRLTGRST